VPAPAEFRSTQTPRTPVRRIREATEAGCANKDKSSIFSGKPYGLNVITLVAS
jgi:hypothetical protein